MFKEVQKKFTYFKSTILPFCIPKNQAFFTEKTMLAKNFRNFFSAEKNLWVSRWYLWKKGFGMSMRFWDITVQRKVFLKYLEICGTKKNKTQHGQTGAIKTSHSSHFAPFVRNLKKHLWCQNSHERCPKVSLHSLNKTTTNKNATWSPPPSSKSKASTKSYEQQQQLQLQL